MDQSTGDKPFGENKGSEPIHDQLFLCLSYTTSAFHDFIPSGIVLDESTLRTAVTKSWILSLASIVRESWRLNLTCFIISRVLRDSKCLWTNPSNPEKQTPCTYLLNMILFSTGGVTKVLQAASGLLIHCLYYIRHHFL